MKAASRILALIASLTFTRAQYSQGQEADYLARFDSINGASYAAVDDIDANANVPPTLLSTCKDTPLVTNPLLVEVTLQEAVTPDEIVNNSANTIKSSSVALQCDASTVCTIPEGITLVMDVNLHVAALIVKGSVLWTDETQLSRVELTEEDIENTDTNTNSNSGSFLCAGYVAVESPGSWLMNLQNKNAWIYLTNNGMAHPFLRSRAFGGIGDGSRVEVIGRDMARAWSLLSEPMLVGSSEMKLLHDPRLMNWAVGDRIAVAPTEKASAGWGQEFRISSIAVDGTVTLDAAVEHDFKAIFKVSESGNGNVATMSAEVVNLQRNIVITGDDFSHVDAVDGLDEAVPGENTSAYGCLKNSYRNKCTYGLHTSQMYGGVMKILNTRIEKCGQRGVAGKYCLHFHKLGVCPDCLLQNNAIENSQQRGIIIHGTHLSTVENNVLYNIRGANVYIEDGNEMHNNIKYNVVICPFPFEDVALGGCTVPGTSNHIADTSDNQTGYYSRAHSNNMIGNRAVNTFNGMFNQALGMGRGFDNDGKVCEADARLGRFDGNVFHGHLRFGTYTLGGNYPKLTDQDHLSGGHNTDMNLCNGFDENGLTRGAPGSFRNQLDYDNVFVGHYSAGDYQHLGHFSYSNNNPIYWKETKNMEDGCSPHFKGGHYHKGNMALPDQGTIIIEDTYFEDVVFEANHHCTVGETGVLCMPQYILHNVKVKASKGLAKWLYFNHHVRNDHTYTQSDGGIFSLAPSDVKVVEEGGVLKNSLFPDGYVSAVSSKFDYLLDYPDDVCRRSSDLGSSMGVRYDSGILCKVPLRALKVYSRDLKAETNPPDLKVEAWFKGSILPDPDAIQILRYHQSGSDGTKKQGFSIPVIPGNVHTYRLTLANGSNVPAEWVIEFSDPVMGNKYGVESILLDIPGRTCSNGGLVTSQHDRRFIWSGDQYLLDDVWGKHGACISDQPDDSSLVDCSDRDTEVNLLECPSACNGTCGTNSYCDCGSKTCQCEAGFGGEQCSIDLCSAARCGPHGHCSARYLGPSSLLPVTSDKACICEDGWSGLLCNLNPCLEKGETCNGNGTCLAVGTDTICECEDGYSGDKCEVSCDGFCLGCGGTYPYCCSSGGLPGIVKYGCNSSGGCSYLADGDFDPNMFCTYKQTQIDPICECPNTNQCAVTSKCDESNECPELSFVTDGTPCNSVPWGVCESGVCVIPCSEDLTDDFVLRLDDDGSPKIRNCGWLQTKTPSKISVICERTDGSGELGPARESCPETCGTCPAVVNPSSQPSEYPSFQPSEQPPCSELSTDRFFLRMKMKNNGEKPVKKTCEWLREKSPGKRRKLCERTHSFKKFGPAKEVCPLTCEICLAPSFMPSIAPSVDPPTIEPSVDPCSGLDFCNNNGTCITSSGDIPFCQCNEGYSGDKCEVSCDGFCLGCGGTYPYCCSTADLPGIVKYGCNSSGGCSYLAEGDFDPNVFCTYREVHTSS